MSAPCPPMSGALCAAAESGDLVDIARLLDAGADINALEVSLEIPGSQLLSRRVLDHGSPTSPTPHPPPHSAK